LTENVFKRISANSNSNPNPNPTLKVYLYRTQPRLDGVREGMVEIKQTKVVYTKRESERGTRL